MFVWCKHDKQQMQMMTFRPVTTWREASLAIGRIRGQSHNRNLRITMPCLLELERLIITRPMSREANSSSNKRTNTTTDRQRDELTYSILAKYGHHASKHRDMCDELKAHDLKLTVGKWTEMELNQLQKNWERYKVRCPIDDPVKVLFKHKCPPGERKELLKISKNTNFVAGLAYMIKRPHRYTLDKAQRLFGKYKRGILTREERETVVELSAIGENNVSIGRIINRQRNIITNYLRTVKEQAEPGLGGRWTEMEDEKLLRIIEECKFDDPLKKVTKYPWADIGAKICRSAKQCKNRYNYLLSVTKTKKGSWTQTEDEKLLRIIEECKIYDPIRNVTHYPWAEIAAWMESRSGKQCQGRYRQNLSKTKGQWTGKEDEKLLGAIEECKTYDPMFTITNYPWAEISSFVEGRSPRQCEDRYRRYLSYTNLSTRQWTEKEDEKLLRIIEECKIYDPFRKVTNYHWEDIGARMERRNAVQCSYRYRNHLVNINFNKGQWTKEEDEKLLRIIEECKPYDPIRKGTNYDWADISARLESRSVSQCRDRHRYLLSTTNVNKGRWTGAEDEKLLRNIEECTTYDPIREITTCSWVEISAKMECRSELQCRQRYRRHLSKTKDNKVVGQERKL